MMNSVSKIYTVTYYDGDSDVTIKLFRDQKMAEKYVEIKNKKEPATKHSGGDYYIVEMELE